MAYTKKSKEFYENRKKEIEGKLDKVLRESFTDAEKMRKLSLHFRITGLYNYSFINSILIASQGGKLAQSFKAWKKLERHVKKGERSKIFIFIPYFKNVDEKNAITGKTETIKKLVGFGTGPVFDIDQTDGKPLEYDHNSEDVIDVDYTELKVKVEKGFDVEITEKYTGSARGYTDGKRIAISEMSNNTDKVKTLVHELAHVVLEHCGKGRKARNVVEVEAEAATLFVESFLGYDVELSETYIANWKSSEIGRDSYKNVIRAADKIIKSLFIEKKAA